MTISGLQAALPKENATSWIGESINCHYQNRSHGKLANKLLAADCVHHNIHCDQSIFARSHVILVLVTG